MHPTMHGASPCYGSQAEQFQGIGSARISPLGGQFHNHAMYGAQEEPIRLEEVESLSRRVKWILHQYTTKLAYSRAGMDERFSKRQGFDNDLREVRDGFQKLEYDLHNIEDDLKGVRETLLAGGDRSPRDRKRLLETIGDVRETLLARGDLSPSERKRLLEAIGVNPHDASDTETFERARIGRLSPRSQGASTENQSIATVEVVTGVQTPDPQEDADSTIMGAILSAAGRNSGADAIVEASKLVVDESRRSEQRGGQRHHGLHHTHHLEQDHLPRVPPDGTKLFVLFDEDLDENPCQSHDVYSEARRRQHSALDKSSQQSHDVYPEARRRHHSVLDESPRQRHDTYSQARRRHYSALDESPRQSHDVYPEARRRHPTALPSNAHADRLSTPQGRKRATIP